MKNQRLLTKSRYKLALDCPNKLFYTRKNEYANVKVNDPFLQSLTDGGFQVEELARLEFPKGILVDDNVGDYDSLVEKTYKLLEQENVVIFEAAFKHKNLFIRTDILVKKGNKVQLIEIKAKSYNPDDEYLFVGTKGKLKGVWKPYLYDVAFQEYVMQKKFPEWNIVPYLMMANKLKTAKVNGLNQMFRVSKDENNRTKVIKNVESIEEVKESVLGRINVYDIVQNIFKGKYKFGWELSFEEGIKTYADFYEKDKFFNADIAYSACKHCEFKATKEEEKKGLKSGFKECWKKYNNWTDTDFDKPNIFELWNFRKGNKFFEEGKFFLEELTKNDLKVEFKSGMLSASERQWIQLEKRLSNNKSYYILKEELKKEMSSWVFPLNFIDFETSAVAIPFNIGRKPYEQVAFQYSHHTVNKDGKTEHQSEFISTEQGLFPNFEFVRALKTTLETNKGSIFMYSPHENTILNAIYTQLENSKETDKKELQNFIKLITRSTQDSKERWEGKRAMIDLLVVIKKYYYNPYAGGSNSIKFILPAIMKTSEFLQNKYKKPLKEINLSSKNFSEDHIWFQTEKNELKNPYHILPQLFESWLNKDKEENLSDIDDITNGGAALTAYGKMQYTEMNNIERTELAKGLLKYCELDTLAMVMIYEHFKEITDF